MKNSNTLSKHNYGRWEVFHPSGRLMFRCVDKRARWYLDRKLAEETGEHTIRLLFEPNGLGDEDNLIRKDNVCVCCGTSKDLTRHHIIPREFRKYFPVEIKSRNSYDILLLCVKHHTEYEAHARQLKSTLIGDTITSFNRKMMGLAVYKKFLDEGEYYETNSSGLASSKAFSKNRILEVFPDAKLTIDDYRELKSMVDTENPMKVVVDSHLRANTLQEFVEMWRKHFVEHIECKFLPFKWNVDKKIVHCKS